MFQLLTLGGTIEILLALDATCDGERGLENSSIKNRIAGKYGQLSERLRQAADYIVDHEIEVATQSLRAISGQAGLAPSTFSRLSQTLGFSSYEEMRDLCRTRVGQQVLSFTQRADRIVREGETSSSASFLDRQLKASHDNLDQLGQDIDQAQLQDVVARLDNARSVLLFGAFSSTGLIEYFAYLARYFTGNWKVIGRMGASLSSAMVDLSKQDAVIVITKSPYAKRSIVASQMAADRGAYVFVITDSHSCPALAHASAHFIVPTESPQFCSSYAATLVLIETLVGMLVARSGEEARTRIEEIERQNHHYGEFWS